MKKTACFFAFMAAVLLMPVLAFAAPAQKYSLMAQGSKVTAYMIEDELYLHPQELAKAYAGTRIKFDVGFDGGVMNVALKKDFSGEIGKFKSKAVYDDAPVLPLDFRVEGIDAVGHIDSVVLEEETFVRLKDISKIVGFTYTRNKATGEVQMDADPVTPSGMGAAGLASDEYIDMAANIAYGIVLSNDDVRVMTKSGDIAKMLVPEGYSGGGIPKNSPLSGLVAESLTASLKEADTRDIDPDKPMVALTFDDGPRAGNTERILEALDAVDGRATFFMVGTNVENYPDTVKAVAEQGSEVANHSYNHPQLTTLGTDAALEQIRKTNGLINDITGITPTIGRPPYGSIDAAIIDGSGMEWFNWSVDTLDWKYRDADTVYNNVISNVSDRDVVLMHDIHASTIDAAVRIIPKLDEMGYQLVTISELCEVQEGAENVSGHIRR